MGKCCGTKNPLNLSPVGVCLRRYMSEYEIVQEEIERLEVFHRALSNMATWIETRLMTLEGKVEKLPRPEVTEF